ncbi:beta-N-acetylhexosaminidase [Paenibacillus lutrae]|uniref:Beta-N-acetylhexosaminidase n=1 Tax=Paenibacillus lutrae TaxID=2078573 RepID=A0A7X3FH85_9BACL|nr:beta-N-acetylhexosaminidase [Paenibacillus lutrae]MVO99592.1 beta-N-acetylhexosaminidase [Paenibacillus lutrae]
MKKLTEMNLRQKIGQMVMCGFSAADAADSAMKPNQRIIQLIKEYEIGGVILFRRNLDTPQQVAELNHELQLLAADTSGGPLLIGIDQEGGMVARIHEGVVCMPGSMAIGATRDKQAAYETARISGKELRAMGINLNFAPCLDVNNNPLNPVIGVRSFGETAELVGELGAAAVKGYQASGVAPTIKHFPGHGDTQSDSHHALPMIPHGLERLREMEFAPFVRAINEGADVIMSAHVIFPALEPDGLPSTLSKRVLTDLLRGELGFGGVIVTDCLEMKAIADHYGTAEGAVMAVEAGADLLLVSHRLPLQVETIEKLVEAVESGRISEARIDESVERLLQLKQKLNITAGDASPAAVSAAVGLPEHVELVRETYRKSVTLVKDEQQLPLASDKKTYVIWTEVRANTQIDEVIEQEETLGAYLAETIAAVTETRIDTMPSEEDVERVLSESKDYDQVIVVTYNASFSPNQIRIVQELAARDTVLTVVAGRNPFDYIEFPEVKTYVASYENRPHAMYAVADVLTGRHQAEGKLPVTLTPEYAFGWSSQA